MVAYSQGADGLPEPENGWLTMPEKPGLGFDIKPEAVAEFLVKA